MTQLAKYLKAVADLLKSASDLTKVAIGAGVLVAAGIADLTQYGGQSALESAVDDAAGIRQEVRDIQGRLGIAIRDEVICKAEPRPYNCALPDPRQDALQAALRSIRNGTNQAINESSQGGAVRIAELDLGLLEERLGLTIATYLRTGVPDIPVADVFEALNESVYFGSENGHEFAERVRSLGAVEQQIEDLQARPDLIERPNELTLWLVRLGIFFGGLLLGIGGVQAIGRLRPRHAAAG